MDATIPLLFCFLISILVLNGSCAAPILGFEIQHRFSDRVRQWANSRQRDFPGGWPEKGTSGYYDALVRHDLSLRGRALDDVAPELFFSGVNEIQRINSLGFLYYAFVSLGTPSVNFLVALDTGSSLFWVPCNCISCAASTSSGLFNIYSPNASTTSLEIPCRSTLCASQNQNKCSGGDDRCPYMVKYVSSETSSSGFLVNDVLDFNTNDIQPQILQSHVVVGCGQVQTGSFLGDAAPDGVFGLGMDTFSVPSVLSNTDLISDSFSMCFGLDGVGRINFGDQGSSDQQETPFNLGQRNSSMYQIRITGIEVNNSSTDVNFDAIVDSGTSFTTFADPAYTKLSDSFNIAVEEERAKTNSSIPFEYCYYLSFNESVPRLPLINLITEGGSKFPVNYPLIFISNKQQRNFMYCLALVKSSKQNIIGQNFLTGLRVVFDRERMVFGWKKFNCKFVSTAGYKTEDSDPLPGMPGNSSTAIGPKKPRYVTTVPSPNDNYSSRLNCFVLFCCLDLLFAALLIRRGLRNLTLSRQYLPRIKASSSPVSADDTQQVVEDIGSL